MKKILIATLISAPAAILSIAANAADGTINFQGQVVDAACSVSANSINQTVILDQVRTSAFTAAGELANQSKSFQISLADCDTAVSQTAQISFNGATDANDASLLANTAGAGAAQNVGLALFGSDGAPVGINDGTLTSAVSIQDGTTIIPLSVDYKSTTAVPTPGPVTSVATFSVTYN